MSSRPVSLDQNYLPVGVARRELIPRGTSGKPVSPSTVWRWHKKGLVGPKGERVRLRMVMIGGRPYVTKDALEEFFTALTPTDDDSAHVSENSARDAYMERRLREAGLLR